MEKHFLDCPKHQIKKHGRVTNRAGVGAFVSDYAGCHAPMSYMPVNAGSFHWTMAAHLIQEVG